MINKKALNSEGKTTNSMSSISQNGFVKLFRNIVDWEWYTEPNVVRLFIHCLIKANHAPKKWQGIIIHAGSFVTSYSKLAQDLKLSERNIRTAINRLKSTGELTHSTTSRYSIITVNNWNEYQSGDTRIDTQLTGCRQTSDRQVTTNNNDKNDKNIYKNILYSGQKTKFKKPSLEEIESYCSERKNNVDAQRFFDYYESVDWHIGKNKMKNWQACIRNWEKNTRNSYAKQEENTFNELPYNPYC